MYHVASAQPELTFFVNQWRCPVGEVILGLSDRQQDKLKAYGTFDREVVDELIEFLRLGNLTSWGAGGDELGIGLFAEKVADSQDVLLRVYIQPTFQGQLEKVTVEGVFSAEAVVEIINSLRPYSSEGLNDVLDEDTLWQSVFPTEAGPIRPIKNPFVGKNESSTSSPGRCGKAPDTCHHWFKLGDGVQSSEVFQCRYCGDVNVD